MTGADVATAAAERNLAAALLAEPHAPDVIFLHAVAVDELAAATARLIRARRRRA